MGEYLDQIPGGRDPWFVLEQTPGIDSDRYNVAGSESGNQSVFYARGALKSRKRFGGTERSCKGSNRLTANCRCTRC